MEIEPYENQNNQNKKQEAFQFIQRDQVVKMKGMNGVSKMTVVRLSNNDLWVNSSFTPKFEPYERKYYHFTP